MKMQLSAFAAAILLSLMLTPIEKSSAEQPDTLYRAAYCAGVLDDERARASSPTASFPICDDPAIQNHHGSKEQCIANAREDMDRLIFRKQERYLSYMRVSALDMDMNMLWKLGAIRKKGEADAKARTTPELYSVSQTQCNKTCVSLSTRGNLEISNQCIVGCAEREDQVLGNIIRCTILPDALPF